MAGGALALVTLGAATMAGAGARQGAPSRALPFLVEHPSLPRGAPEAVLYVSDACRWCDAELDAWGKDMPREGPLGPLVVLSPGSDPDAAGLLPGALARRVVHDADGSLARALGVEAVPVLLRLDSAGRVVAVTVGLSRASDRALARSWLESDTQPQEAPR